MTIKFRGKHVSGFVVDLPVTPFTFPAGEADLKISDNFSLDNYEYFIADIRGHDPQDLFHLAMWADLIDSESDPLGGFRRKVVLLPYIPAARADRGVPLASKVYAQVFNGLFLDQVISIDPHSPVAGKFYESSEKIGSANMTSVPVERVIKRVIQDKTSDSRPQPYNGVIAPDKGAHERASAAANVMGVPVYTAGKTRNFKTGALTGFHMEDQLPSEGRFLIVDDICDGGGSFLGLAAEIKESNPDVHLDLWVTHGIFSQGFARLSKAFGMIHTTNSYFPGEPTYLPSRAQGLHVVPENIITHDITADLYRGIV